MAAMTPGAATTAPSSTGGATAGYTPAAGLKKGTTLNFYFRGKDDSTEFAGTKAATAEWTKLTGVNVNFVNIGDDDPFHNRVRTEAAAKQSFDVVGPVPHDWLGEFQAEGALATLPADFFGSSKDQFLKVALDATNVQGQQVAAPVFIESVALIYNKKLVPTVPKTFDELVTTAKSLTKGDQYGFVTNASAPYFAYGFATSYGGYIFKRSADGKYDANDVGLANDGAVKGFQYLNDLIQKQGIMPATVADKDNGGNTASDLFKNGKAAMQINGPWSISDIKKANIDYGVAAVPQLPGATGPFKPFSGIQVFGVGGFSKNQPEATDLVKYLTSAKVAVQLAAAATKTPVRQDALADPELAKAYPDYKFWLDQAQQSEPMPNITAMNQVWGPWGDALVAANNGQAPVKDAFTQAVTAIKKNIAANK